MADRYFEQAAHRFHIGGKIFVFEIVARVDAESDSLRSRARLAMIREDLIASGVPNAFAYGPVYSSTRSA